MNFGKRKCIDCGYLCFKFSGQRFLGQRGTTSFPVAQYEPTVSYEEITTKERGGIDIQPNSKDLFCYRREVSFEVDLEAIHKFHESSGSPEFPELYKKEAG